MLVVLQNQSDAGQVCVFADVCANRMMSQWECVCNKARGTLLFWCDTLFMCYICFPSDAVYCMYVFVCMLWYGCVQEGESNLTNLIVSICMDSWSMREIVRTVHGNDGEYWSKCPSEYYWCCWLRHNMFYFSYVAEGKAIANATSSRKGSTDWKCRIQSSAYRMWCCTLLECLPHADWIIVALQLNINYLLTSLLSV